LKAAGTGHTHRRHFGRAGEAPETGRGILRFCAAVQYSIPAIAAEKQDVVPFS